MSLLFEHSASFGNAPALVDLGSGESISHARLRDVLRAHVPADSGKPVILSGAPEFGAALRLLAVLSSGRLAVPISPRLPAAEVRRRGAQIAGPGAAMPMQAGTILFTSGSSGRPKAVLHDLASHEANARAAAGRIPLGEGCGWLLNLPMHHVSGLAVLVRCLLSGAAVVFPDRSRSLVEALRHPAVTHVSVVAVQLQRLLEEGGGIPSLQAVLGGGGPFSSTLVGKALGAGVPLHLTYGMTETASQIATSERLDAMPERVHAGRPLSGTDVRLSGEGEIFVKSPGMARMILDTGEWRSPVDADGWFGTGDLGAFSSDGELCITGRKDRMLVSGGENIHPEAIECLLAEVPGVRRAAVVAVAHREFGQRPVVFLDGSVEERELRDYLGTRLERFAIPDRFFSWPEGIAADAAKIDYPALAAIARGWTSGG